MYQNFLNKSKRLFLRANKKINFKLIFETEEIKILKSRRKVSSENIENKKFISAQQVSKTIDSHQELKKYKKIFFFFDGYFGTVVSEEILKGKFKLRLDSLENEKNLTLNKGTYILVPKN